MKKNTWVGLRPYDFWLAWMFCNPRMKYRKEDLSTR